MLPPLRTHHPYTRKRRHGHHHHHQRLMSLPPRPHHTTTTTASHTKYWPDHTLCSINTTTTKMPSITTLQHQHHTPSKSHITSPPHTAPPTHCSTHPLPIVPLPSPPPPHPPRCCFFSSALPHHHPTTVVPTTPACWLTATGCSLSQWHSRGHRDHGASHAAAKSA